MARFTRFQDGDVAAIAAAFEVGPVHRWGEVAAGTINSNFWVETARGRFFLRVNEGKSEADVRYEAALVAALAAAGVPTAPPLSGPAGAPFVVHRERRVSLFPWLPGSHRGRGAIGDRHARALGRALATLHRVGLQVASEFEHSGIYTFDHICQRVESLTDVDARTAGPPRSPPPALAPALAVVAEEIAWQRRRASVRDGATRGIIHGDLFPDNVLWDGDHLALLDFEQASSGSLAYDLAVCINAWCYDDDFAPSRIAALIAGYQQARRLPAADVRALPLEVRAAAMRFTVTRITDVYLPGLDAPTKDFRRYLARLERWREVGAKGLLSWAELGE